MTVRPSKPARRSLLERRAFGLLLVVACAAPAVGLACSSATRTTTTSNGGNGNGGNTSGGGGEGGDLFGDAGPETGLELLPQNPALKVEVPLQGQTLQFQCMDKETGLPASGATWSLSIPDLGTIDQAGLFTPNGTHTGEVLVRCEQGIRTAESLLKVTIHARRHQGQRHRRRQRDAEGPPRRHRLRVEVPLSLRGHRVPARACSRPRCTSRRARTWAPSTACTWWRRASSTTATSRRAPRRRSSRWGRRRGTRSPTRPAGRRCRCTSRSS
jgi:hypothetical protein